MKHLSKILLCLFTFSTISALCNNSEQVSIHLQTRTPGINILPNSNGVSYETVDIMPKLNGEYYFHPDNEALINMFKVVGIKNLRIGGNSVDAPNIPLPKMDDIHMLFQFARKAEVKVVYSLRLQSIHLDYCREVAKLINDNYKDIVESIAIGNEPHYYKEDKEYIEKWRSIHDVVLKVYPDARFSGPNYATPNVSRIKALMEEADNENGRLMQITQHMYPMGGSYQKIDWSNIVYLKLKPQDREKSRAKMLDPNAYNTYEKMLHTMNNVVSGSKLRFRLSETNSFWFSGLREVSNSFTSALWGCDYMYWWMTNGCEGVNFHSGDVTGGRSQQPAFYTPIVSSEKGYAAMPLAYGMKLFAMGSNGKNIPVDIQTPNNENIVAYSTINSNGEVLLTIINKQYKVNKKEKITIILDKKIKKSKIETIALEARNNDIAEISDITLGGEPINDDGTWNGKWTILENAIRDKHTFEVTINSASAWLIKISN